MTTTQQHGTRPVAFSHDGIDYKAFPEQGSFFGVGTWKGRTYLSQVPMLIGGGPDMTTEDGREVPNTVQVSNMHEEGDEQLLLVINAEFGSNFKQSDFAGR